MKKNIPIRQKVAEILTELFGNVSDGIIFRPEDTIKRSGGKKASKYELQTSLSWSSRSSNEEMIYVSCVGMTMVEFIKEYEKRNIYYTESAGIPKEVTIYLNSPIWKTSGYVKKIDLINKQLILNISDIILIDEINIQITTEIPKWLYKKNDQLPFFTCKIFQDWRMLNSLDNLNWSKIWKTFKFKGYLSDNELNSLI